jgi:DNA-binding winged helix-turn-helix (wHTH) protein
MVVPHPLSVTRSFVGRFSSSCCVFGRATSRNWKSSCSGTSSRSSGEYSAVPSQLDPHSGANIRWPVRLVPGRLRIGRQLTKRNQPIPLPPKTLDVLLALVRHAGRLVTKHELLQSVWPDAFVEEAILAVHVSSLRKRLDENNGSEPSIETVSRSGYRFRSEVTRLPDHDATSRGVRDHAGSAPDKASIAILHFVNLNGDPEQEYFSDGLSDEIIHTLTCIPGLKVIARTSAFAFKNTSADIRRIAYTLGVANVLAFAETTSRRRLPRPCRFNCHQRRPSVGARPPFRPMKRS